MKATGLMRRTRSPLVLVVVLGLSFKADGQQRADSRPENLITIHAEVLRQSDCHVDDEAFTASLALRLKLTSSSSNPVILARKIEAPIVRVARSVEKGQRNEFLLAPDPHFAVADLPDAPYFGEKPDHRVFVILSHGESFETIVQSGVFGANDPAIAGKGSGLLAKGSYVLQLGVMTWPYQWPWFSSDTKPDELTLRWRKYGELATGLVYSDFAPFTLPEHFKNPPCPPPSKKLRVLH